MRDEVLRQVEDLAKNGPNEEELAMVRAAFANGLQSIGDSAGSLARFYAREYQYDLHRSPAQRAAVLDQLGPEDVRAAAATWQPDLSFLMAAPEPSLQEQA